MLVPELGWIRWVDMLAADVLSFQAHDCPRREPWSNPPETEGVWVGTTAYGQELQVSRRTTATSGSAASRGGRFASVKSQSSPRVTQTARGPLLQPDVDTIVYFRLFLVGSTATRRHEQMVTTGSDCSRIGHGDAKRLPKGGV